MSKLDCLRVVFSRLTCAFRTKSDWICELRAFPVRTEFVELSSKSSDVRDILVSRSRVRTSKERLDRMYCLTAEPTLRRQLSPVNWRTTPWFGADQRRRMIPRRRRVVTGVAVAFGAPTRGRTGRLQPGYVFDDADRGTSSTSSTTLTS